MKKSFLKIDKLNTSEIRGIIKEDPAIIRKRNFDSYNNAMKKYHAYEICQNEYGDKCSESHCHYSVLHLKNNSSIWFTCGRRKEEGPW